MTDKQVELPEHLMLLLPFKLELRLRITFKGCEPLDTDWKEIKPENFDSFLLRLLDLPFGPGCVRISVNGNVIMRIEHNESINDYIDLAPAQYSNGICFSGQRSWHVYHRKKKIIRELQAYERGLWSDPKVLEF